jgi:hypothetical protein
MAVFDSANDPTDKLGIKKAKKNKAAKIERNKPEPPPPQAIPYWHEKKTPGWARPSTIDVYSDEFISGLADVPAKSIMGFGGGMGTAGDPKTGKTGVLSYSQPQAFAPNRAYTTLDDLLEMGKINAAIMGARKQAGGGKNAFPDYGSKEWLKRNQWYRDNPGVGKTSAPESLENLFEIEPKKPSKFFKNQQAATNLTPSKDKDTPQPQSVFNQDPSVPMRGSDRKKRLDYSAIRRGLSARKLGNTAEPGSLLGGARTALG